MDERNLKQVDIVELCKPYSSETFKMSKPKLSQYLSGTHKPGNGMLTLLGSALGVSELWLMGYDVPMERQTPSIESDEDRKRKRLYSKLEKVPKEELDKIEKMIDLMTGDV